MSLDSTQVMVAGSATLYLADTGATFSGGTAAPGSAWTDCGYMTDAGATFTMHRTIQDLLVWQGLDPVRKITTAQSYEISLTLRQWNPANVKFALGGGTAAGGTPGTYTFPSVGQNVERAVLLDTTDSTTLTRFYFPRMAVAADVAVALGRTDSMNLPISLQSLTGTALPQIISTETSFVF